MKHEKIPLRKFSALSDKNVSTQKLDNLPQHRRVPLRCFSVLRDNKLLTENRDTPLLGIKFFDTRNFQKHRRAPLQFDSVL